MRSRFSIKKFRSLKVTNTNGYHLAGVSGGVVLQLQSSGKIFGYLICTFSNPLLGVVKSKVSLFKSSSVQPGAIRDMMLEQYWNMNDFELTCEETYGNIREADQRQGSTHNLSRVSFSP